MRAQALQEAAQKFFARQGHGALLVVVCIVFPSEEHLGFVDRHNAVVGNGHTMRIASQIVQDVFRPAKRWLGVNDPIFLKQGVQKCREGFLIGQRQALSVEWIFN